MDPALGKKSHKTVHHFECFNLKKSIQWIVIGQMLQTPLLCARAHTQTEQTWVDFSS